MPQEFVKKPNKLEFIYRYLICLEKSKYPNKSTTVLAKWLETKYNQSVSQKTIWNILQNSDSILNFKNQQPNKSVSSYPQYPEVDYNLIEFVLKFQSKVNLTDIILQTKAKQLGQKFYPNSDFKASNGWVYGFKKRFKLHCYIKQGESQDVNQITIDASLPIINSILTYYHPSDIFNMDETSLFYKQMVYILLY